MSAKKKQVRENFRTAVFTRDKYRCVCCGFQSSPAKCREELDAHHIQNREIMPSQGYVKENGISVCKSCHEKCELYHQGLECPSAYTPDALYLLIGSSYELAIVCSKRL